MTLYNIMRGWLLLCGAALAETVSATKSGVATVADIVCQGPFIVGRESEEKEGLRDRGREGGREAVYGHVIRDIGKEERKEESRRQERTLRGPGTDIEK